MATGILSLIVTHLQRSNSAEEVFEEVVYTEPSRVIKMHSEIKIKINVDNNKRDDQSLSLTLPITARAISIAAPTTNTIRPSTGLGRSVPVAYRMDPSMGPSALPGRGI